MKYKVFKRFYDPLAQGYKFPGEFVEVEDKHLEGYKPYILIEEKPVRPYKKKVK